MDTSYTIADEVFTDCQRKANPIHYLTPTNTKEAYKAFKGGKDIEFTYPALSYDPSEVEQALLGLTIPPGELHDVYERKRKELLLANELIQKRDDPSEVRRLTKALYGSPDPELIEVAETTLGEAMHEPVVGETPQEVHDAIVDELKALGISGWKVTFSKQFHTTFTTAEKMVTVCEDRKFHIGDKDRTRVSLVDVHILRAHNGEEQQYGIFRLGLPSCMATEEGLAAYSEELTEHSQGYDLRKYASVVVATHYMEQGLTLREAFDKLMAFKAFSEADRGDLYSMVTRVYRAGGFYKDHNYLRGYLDVKRYHEGGGDLSLLWVGKIGLHDLPLVNELLVMEKLKQGWKVPEFARKED